MNSSATTPAAAVQACERLARAIHQQHAVGQLGERVVQRLALEPHAVGDVLAPPRTTCRRRSARSTSSQRHEPSRWR